MARSVRTLVLGGGIAGLSVAWQLARGGGRAVRLLEREAALGTHSSARNAQIWLPVEEDGTTGALARRSAALLTGLMGSEAAWLARSPALVITPDEALAGTVERGALGGGLRTRRLDSAARRRVCPALAGSALEELALGVDGAGVFDPHAMVTALGRAAVAEGVEVLRGTAAGRVLVANGRVRGAELEGGRVLEADEVVLASGAWAGALAKSAGVELAMVALRRHLVLLHAPRAQAGTTVWRFGPEEVYFRPEGDGVLASPCDETPWEPGVPTTSPEALESLASRLESIAPALYEAGVKTRWACLRTFAHDRELLLGPDPRVEGLAWMTGFGGRGMTVAVAAGEVCAQAMRGERSTLAERTRPERPQPAALSPP